MWNALTGKAQVAIVLLAVFVIGFSTSIRVTTASKDPLARQAEAQEKMAKELNDIKQILGSWEWEGVNGEAKLHLCGCTHEATIH
jgi:hypothetical protein